MGPMAGTAVQDIAEPASHHSAALTSAASIAWPSTLYCSSGGWSKATKGGQEATQGGIRGTVMRCSGRCIILGSGKPQPSAQGSMGLVFSRSACTGAGWAGVQASSVGAWAPQRAPLQHNKLPGQLLSSPQGRWQTGACSAPPQWRLLGAPQSPTAGRAGPTGSCCPR